MTRYARAKGSKACNARQSGSATKWNLLKNQVVSENGAVNHVAKTAKSNEKRIAISDFEAAWYDFFTESESMGKEMKKISKKYISQKEKNHTRKDLPKYSLNRLNSMVLEGSALVLPEVSNDAKKIHHARNKKSELGNESTHKCRQEETEKSSAPNSKHIRSSENLTGIKSAIQEVSLTESRNALKTLRRMEKVIKREKKKVCFCCRRWGHQLAECPELGPETEQDVVIPSGCFCYNCGSTEHKMSQCSKTGRKTVKFACCFVCGEEGHLARFCPDNPKGTYPKGGACLTCGEVDHLHVDCPKIDKNCRETESSLTFMTSGPVESLPEDLRTSCASVKLKKIIQF